MGNSKKYFLHFSLMKRLPHQVCFILLCSSLAYSSAQLNESRPIDSISNERRNFGNHSLKEHYETIINLLQKSIIGEKFVRLVDKKLPLQVLGCIQGDLLVISTSSIHKRSETSKAHGMICSDEINAAAVVDFGNAYKRLNQFNNILRIITNSSDIMPTLMSVYNGHRGVTEIGMYLIDDCDDENTARYLIQYVEDWSKNVKNPCSLHSPAPALTVGKFSPFPRRSLNSTFFHWEPTIDHTREIMKITKQEVQNFSFETFKDSYIICSILRHFGWTRVGLIHDNEFSGDRFIKVAEFFNICVSKLSLANVDNYARNLQRHRKFFSDLRWWEEANVYVIFTRRPRVFEGVIQMIELSGYINEQVQVYNKNIFITSEDSLPQDKKLIQSSTFLVFREEANSAETESLDEQKLKLMREYLMTNETSNSTDEKNWLNELECTFPEDEFMFVGNTTLNNTGNETEFPDRKVSSNKKCNRDFLAKLDEIFYKFMKFEHMNCRFEGLCPNILAPLLTQFSADNSWLKSSTINLKIEPHNLSIGNGTWDTLRRKIIFDTTPNATDFLSDVESKCATTSFCNPGQIEKVLTHDRPCCWECRDCESNQIIIWNECHTCEPKKWPNENRTECLPKKKRPLQWTDREVVVSVSYSTAIMLMTVATLWIFIKNRNTPVVKSSTRELSFMMLIAMIAVECTIFIFMSSPEKPRCRLIHIISLLSFGTIYAGLLVRTVRIARLLALSKHEFPQQNMKCMSSKSQVVITINLIIVELILALLMLYNANPLVMKNRNYLDSHGKRTSMITPVCQHNLNVFASHFSFVFGLIALCTGCAVWVRKVPDNFNEAKYIGFCMYATCLTWTAFGFTLFGNHNHEVLALCACFSTNNLLALIFLFFPKLYIILFKPEKNHRKYFNTSKSIRIHKKESKKMKTDLLLKDLGKGTKC